MQQVAALIPSSIVQQLAAQLPVRSEGDEKESPNFLLLAPWGHHQIILDFVDFEYRIFSSRW